MARWQPLPFVGGAYADDATPWATQSYINYIPVKAEREGTRSPIMPRQAPGCSLFSADGVESAGRGMHNAEGLLVVVKGQTLYSVAADGGMTSLGTIPGVGRCSIAHNQITDGNQIAVANGLSGYVYNTVTDSLAQITDDGFPGAKVFDFVDQYIVGVEPQGRYWFWSDLAAAGDYNTLDRAEAETAPDKIVTLITTHGEVFVLGERTSEFFYNTGAATGTFQRRDAGMEIGCAAAHSVVRLDNSVVWLGHDGSVYRLNGYTPQRISTHPIEQAIARCNMADAYAYTFEDRGHKIYYLTFTDGQTFGFDMATGEWHRRKSYGLDFWRMSHLVRWSGAWMGLDYTDGSLYQLDWRLNTDAGQPLERIGTLPPIHDNGNRLIVNALKLELDTGITSESSPMPALLIDTLPTITGALPDGTVGDTGTLQYSITGGVLPYSAITVTSGSLPPGATMDADGLVDFTYSTAGSYSWTVGGTDALGRPFSVADSATIAAAVLYMASLNGVVSGDASALNTNISPAVLGAEPLIKFLDGELFYLSSGTTHYVRDAAGVWQTLSGLPTSSSNFRDIVKTSAGYIVLVKTDRYVYHSTDGRTFSAVDCAGVGQTLNASCIMQVGDTLCIDYATPATLDRKSVDGGLTWSNGTFRTGLANFNPAGASARSGNTVVAVGAYSNYNRVRVSTNGMATWSDVATAATAGLEWSYVAFNGTRFLILKTSGATGTSTTGSSGWATGPSLAASVSGSFRSNRLCAYSGSFIFADAITGGTVGAVAFKSDGVAAWSNINSSVGAVIGGTSIAGSDGDL